MTYSRSPRSNSRPLRKIALPEEIKTFFAQRNKFIRGLPSYEQVEGSHPHNHDHCFDMRYSYPQPLQETHPVNNVEIGSYESAQEKTKELLHLFFRAHIGNISEPLREYMLTGGTKPIRVSSHIGLDGRIVFVKLPSIERIIGLSLYNLISDNTPIDFIFSEYVFVEDSVSGRHIEDENIKYFQALHELPSSLVRLAMQDKFLGLNDLDRTIDLPKRKNIFVNILVQPDGNAVAFDVDCAFTTKETKYDLVDIARERGIDIPTELEKRVKKEEAKRIIHIIDATSYKAFNKFLSLMDKITPLKSQLKEMGFDNARDYFLERERWLKGIAYS